MKTPRLEHVIVLTCLFTLLCSQVDAQVDRLNETWTVTIGNQTVYPNPDGSFLVPSITLIDQDGDLQGDELLRVFAIGRKPDGTRQYASSGFFRLVQGETLFVDSLTFSDTPPAGFIQSVRIAGPETLAIGDLMAVSTFVTPPNGDEEPAQTAAEGTTYRSSNPTVLSVTDQGVVEGVSPGNATIIAMNAGAAGVHTLRVLGAQFSTTVRGYVQQPSGDCVPGALVELTDRSSTMTDGTGRFEIEINTTDPVTAIQAIVYFDNGIDRFVGRSASTSTSRDAVTDLGIIVLEQEQPTYLFDHAAIAPSGSGQSSQITDFSFEDINGDHISDLIAIAGDELVIFTADNGGKFTESYRGPSIRARFEIVDHDGDGDPDIVSASSNTAVVWENLGNNDWQSVHITIEGLAPLYENYQFVKLADLDSDGHFELILVAQATPSSESIVIVSRNDGFGNYVDPIVYCLVGTTQRIGEFAIVDLNSDGHLDAVAYNSQTLTPELRPGFNDGSGNLSWSAPVVLGISTGFNGYFIDTNQDSHIDFVTTSFENNPSSLVTFLNSGNGLDFVQVPSAIEMFFTATSGDFDLDGKEDILGARIRNPGGNPTLFEGKLAYGDGMASFQGQCNIGSQAVILGKTGDGNGDGFPDAAYSYNGNIRILQNDCSGKLRAERLQDAGFAPDELLAADMTGDGTEDVIGLKSLSFPRGVAIARNTGDGNLTFGSATSISASGGLRNISPLDLNGDSLSDLALLKFTGHSNSASIVFLENQGMGSLSLANQIPIGGPFGGLTVANFDQDLSPELLVVQPGVVRVFKLTDNFTVQELPSSTISHIPQQRAGAGDFDADGDLDLIVYQYDIGQLIFLEHTAPATFVSGAAIAGTENAVTFAVQTINADIFPDLVFENSQGFQIYYGSPSGLVPGPTLERSIANISGCIADFNLDGIQDFASQFSTSGIAVSTSLNAGAAFESQVYAGFVTNVDFVAIDLDLDGDSDILLSDRDNGLFLIHENRLR